MKKYLFYELFKCIKKPNRSQLINYNHGVLLKFQKPVASLNEKNKVE